MRPRTRSFFFVVACAALVSSVGTGTIASADGCAPAPITFSEPTYIDTTRAGGEPIIFAHPDGRLLVGGHAGTTHFYTPAAADADTAGFVQNYTGQTYIWTSDDHGATWTFVPRSAPASAPLQGFSDPDFGIDAAGNLYFSEINLVNVAASRSTDGGDSWELQNFFAQTITDRQWMEGDLEGLVYLTGNVLGGGTVPTKPAGNEGHFIYRSTNGGETWDAGNEVDGGGNISDLRIDRRTGTLYEFHAQSGNAQQGDTLSMAVFAGARQGDMTEKLYTIAKGAAIQVQILSMDIDEEGNLYVVWDETGGGPAERAAGIWYSYSTDGAKSWSAPMRVDATDGTDAWPWITVGDPGRVGIAWLETDVTLPGNDISTEGDHGWDVVGAQVIHEPGCSGVRAAGVRFPVARSVVTDSPFHSGTICNFGTACQAQAVDRRLGDYFSIDIDDTGRMVGSYTDTRRGGSVGYPAFFRQTGGESFFEAAATSPRPNVLGRRTGRRPMPRTGTADMIAAFGLTALAVALGLRRWVARGR